jgi:hypothetical protein
MVLLMVWMGEVFSVLRYGHYTLCALVGRNVHALLSCIWNGLIVHPGVGQLLSYIWAYYCAAVDVFSV